MNRLPDDPRLPPHARGTLFAGALVIAFAVFTFGLSSVQVAGFTAPALFSFVHAGGALLVAAVTLRLRKLTLARVVAAEALLILPLFYEVWLRHAWLMDVGVQFTPFQGLKLIVMAIALIVPAPVWVHVFWLSGLGVLSAVIWERIHLAGLPTAYRADEPWFTIVFFVAGFSLLIYRSHSQNVARRLLIAEARSRAFASVARLFLRMRDETNTPLQNLRLAIELVAQRYPDAGELVSRMRTAVARLEAVRGNLARYDHLITWDGSELHADPELETLLAELEKEADQKA